MCHRAGKRRIVQREYLLLPDHDHREVHAEHEELTLGEVAVALDLVSESEDDRDCEVGGRPSERRCAYGVEDKRQPHVPVKHLEKFVKRNANYKQQEQGRQGDANRQRPTGRNGLDKDLK